jgi:hypothetical protein
LKQPPHDVPGIFRPRHPERTVLYRVLFHDFDRFLTAYESRFEKEYGHFRPVVKEVAERYLDCGNPRYGFARIRCPGCYGKHLLTFSCKTRGFCPSCHAKHREEWGQWVREALLLDVPHRQVVLTIRKTAQQGAGPDEDRGRADREPHGPAILALDRLSFLDSEGQAGYRHGDDGAELERMDHLELIARVTSHIPDKGQTRVRYNGLYANTSMRMGCAEAWLRQ